MLNFPPSDHPTPEMNTPPPSPRFRHCNPGQFERAASERGRFPVGSTFAARLLAFGVLAGATLSVEAQDLDSQFNPNVGGGSVDTIAVQSDGKILIGGSFTSVGGTARNRIARVNSDGSLDTTFNPNANDEVYSLFVRSDGTIIVGGAFSSIAGRTRNGVARLFSNGSADTGFNPNANSSVRAVSVQSDGTYVLAGEFETIDGHARNRIARWNTSNTIDSNFNPDANDGIWALATQPDGRILIGGFFTTISGQARSRVARLEDSGTLDASFNPNVNNVVHSFAIQNDGKILIGGGFTTVGGQTRNRIARLNPDGTLDSSFDPDANSTVNSVMLQSDGKILVGGSFTSIGGQVRNRIARLNSDGSLDGGFDANAGSGVNSVAIQADGGILLGGYFSIVASQSRNRVARLLAPTATRVIELSGDLSFGNVQTGQSLMRTLTIRNTGNLSLSVTNLSYPSGFSGNWGGGSIPSGDEQTVTVTFAPSSEQSYGGNIVVTSNATDGTNTIPVSGQGTAVPTPTRVIELSGSLSFGNVASGQTATRTLTIRNTGNSSLNVTSVAYPSGYSGNWTDGSIAAGGEQDVTVTFAPSAAQSYGGNIVVASNATSGTNAIAASGQGTGPDGGDDHGDNTSGATPIGQNGTSAGVLGASGDSDYFRIVVTESGVLTVQTVGSTDTFGHLLDANANEIAFDDNGGDGANFRIARTLLPGTYYLRIRHSSGTGTGAYDLLSTLTPTAVTVILAPPVGVSARAVGNSTVLVRWRKAPSHGSAVVYKVGMKGPRSPWRNTVVGSTLFRHTKLKPNTRYSYRASAIDRLTGSESRPSPTVSARTRRNEGK